MALWLNERKRRLKIATDALGPRWEIVHRVRGKTERHVVRGAADESDAVRQAIKEGVRHDRIIQVNRK